MKKLFSKALSLVLTLALLATVFSFIGVTASAASNITETPENGSKEVYFIDFTNAPGGQQGEVVAYVPADSAPEGTCEGAEIKISYSYYLKSEHYVSTSNEIYARNWYLGNSSDDADVPDEDTGLSYLKEGMGSFSATYTCPTASFLYGVSKEKIDTPTNADLYIWDLEVYVDNVRIDTNPIKDHQNSSPYVDVSVVSYEEMFNAQKAWKCTFDGVAPNIAGFALTPHFGFGSASVRVEFDYYYDATSSFLYLHNATGENFDSVKHDGTEINRFQLGTHHLVAESAGFPSTEFALRVQNGGLDTLNGVLYVWNVNLYIDDVKYNDKITPLNSYLVEDNATNGFIVEEGTYGELMATRKAYCLDYSMLSANNGELGHWWSYMTHGTEWTCELSFNYKVVNAATSEVLCVHGAGGGSYVATGGDNPGTDRLIADGKEHHYEYVGVPGVDGVAINFYFLNPTRNPDLKVYVWDFHIRNTAMLINECTIETRPENGEANYHPFEVITYADVVNASPVMALDFATAESEIVDNNLMKADYQLSGNQQGGADGDVVVHFDYYLANAAADEICVYNVAGGSMEDDKLGTSYLQPGRHTFTINKKHSEFGAGAGSNILVAVGLGKNVESNAKLYIWNLTCTRVLENRTVYEFGGYNLGVSDAANTVYAGPEASMVSYADVENKADINNDGATNVLDLIRAKRVALNAYLTYDKANFDYAALDAEALVEIKKAVLA